jgi:hypothetical protein
MNERTTTITTQENTVLIATPTTTPGPDAMEEFLHQLIASNWIAFAAAAYEGFRRHGTGVLVITSENEEPESEENESLTISLSYAVSRAAWLKEQLRAPDAGWMQRQMAHYDPSATVLYMIVFGSETRAYRVSSTVSPEAALQALKARLN